jgi:hypothetical protein
LKAEAKHQSVDNQVLVLVSATIYANVLVRRRKVADTSQHQLQSSVWASIIWKKYA